jgi:hypothetical protein
MSAAAQAHHLRVDGHATKGDDGLDATRQVVRQVTHHLAHLHGQLARGHEHQHTQAVARTMTLVALVEQVLQHRQRKGRRLARARLGQAQHIVALQDGGNGRLLDGRGCIKTPIGGDANEAGLQAQCSK